MDGVDLVIAGLHGQAVITLHLEKEMAHMRSLGLAAGERTHGIGRQLVVAHELGCIDLPIAPVDLDAGADRRRAGAGIVLL